MMSSVVDSNLMKVKIVERQCSTFLLFEVLLIVVEQVLDFPLDIAELTHVNLIFSHQKRGKKGSAQQEFFEILQYTQKVFVGHPYHISQTPRIFDAQLCEDIFKLNLFAVSASPSSKITIKIGVATALRYLD